MNKINYQRELDRFIEELTRQGVTPKLLLHSCCAPCSSYVLSYLSDYFSIYLLYYNPNIAPKEEYEKRREEQRRLIEELPVKNPVIFLESRYDPEVFYERTKEYADQKEGQERCSICYEMRLREAAEAAVANQCDYFTTTLSISPLKDAKKLNQIGMKLSETYKVLYLMSDFKKKSGYQKSIILSKQYHLYRQNYCGCIYSKAQINLERKSEYAADRQTKSE